MKKMCIYKAAIDMFRSVPSQRGNSRKIESSNSQEVPCLILNIVADIIFCMSIFIYEEIIYILPTRTTSGTRRYVHITPICVNKM